MQVLSKSGFLFLQLVHHRILQFCLQGLFPAKEEKALLDLLDCIGELCTEMVDTAIWDTTRRRLQEAVVNFEEEFPMLMVRIS